MDSPFRHRRRHPWMNPDNSSDSSQSQATTMSPSFRRRVRAGRLKPRSQYLAEIDAEMSQRSADSVATGNIKSEDPFSDLLNGAVFPMSLPQAEPMRQVIALPIRNKADIMPEVEAESSVKAESSTTQAVHNEVEEEMPERPQRRPRPDVVGHPPRPNDFLEWYPPGNASILFYSDESQRPVAIHNLDVGIIGERCPLLAAAFEESRGCPRLYLEMLSWETAWPFLRFLYSGTYALVEPYGDFYADVPTSVLLHCQLYQLGDLYDLPELKTQAYVNVLRQCEFGCSSPEKPIDLCVAITFVYEHLRKHDNLIDAIINYCVSCFDTHKLAKDAEFKELAYALRPFHQDLCKNSMARGYENDTASAIIQMPFEPYKPDTYASRDDFETFRSPKDVVYHFHSYDAIDEDSPKKRKRAVEGKRRVDWAADLAQYQEHGDLSSGPVHPYGLIPDEMGFDDTIKVEDDSESFQQALGRLQDARKRKIPRSNEGPAASSNPSDVSDSEYEVLPGPKPVEEISSDGESDCSTLVEITREEVPEDTTAQGLPIRLRTADMEAEVTSETQVDSDSESAWTLV